MAKVTHVAKAQVRYPTKPVLGPDGQPERVKINRTAKGGREVFRTRMHEDRTQPPLPPRTCESCRKPIEPGTAYKWVAPRSGPYGGGKRYRHESCPPWQEWDLHDSLSAQLSRVSWEFGQAVYQAEDEQGVQEALDQAAQEVRDLAEQKRESASNIEEGFGHPTSQSEELESTADELESWADEIESASIPELEEGEEDEDEDAVEERLQAWRDEVADELTIVDEVPV